LEILGQAPDVVINSHYHNDHIWGNQVFLPDAQIIASRRTRHFVDVTELRMERYFRNELGVERSADI
jgi:glyoxylase-like metal-dependent hydrolase (beta-lactamase superfamily II)